MKIGYYVPHRLPSHPDGHVTRNRVLNDAIPGLITIEPGPKFPKVDRLIVDTHPLGVNGELVQVLPAIQERGGKTILLARGLSQLEPDYPHDVRLTFPYEGERGDVIAPLVPVEPKAKQLYDVLVVPSRLFHSRMRHWAAIADELVKHGFDVTLMSPAAFRTKARTITGDAALPMAQARVVVGGAGTGTLYGALWTGKPYVVANAFTREQEVRLRLALAAGERIVDGRKNLVDAVTAAMEMEPRRVRKNGVAALLAAIE
jgi:hypothetical protein